MKYRYRESHEMKDSGVEWLGMIPKEWEIKKIKYLCNIGTGGKDTQDKNPEGKYNFFVRSPIIEKIDSYSFDGEAILMAGDGVGAGKVFHYYIGKFDYHQRVYKFSNFRILSGKVLYFYLKQNFYKEIEKGSAKTTVDSLRLPMISNFPVVYNKNKKQQRNLINFLDKKCEEFDSVIAKKEMLINKLEEAKKSLISEVVTGKVKVIQKENGEYGIIKREVHEMKDSGVEWLGVIPKEWRTSKIKYNTYVKGRIGWQGLKSDEFIEVGAHLVTGTDFKSNSINWETCYRISEERYKEAPTIHLRNGDLLITKDGTIGKLAIVESCPEQAVLNSGVFVTRCLNLDYLTKFMFYILDSKIFSTYIDINKTGSTILHLYQETFVKFSYPLPNLTIQNNIIKFLDEKCSQFDITIEKQKEIIEKLKSAKQSLISEAVTGKIEIL